MSDEQDDEIVSCRICGARGTLDELFEDLPGACDGSGFVEYYLRCCCNHGKVECLGCPNCETEEDDE